MWNARLDEAQAGIKIAGRNINNIRYADDTTLIAESKKELKICLMSVNEESEKTGLKLNIQLETKAKINKWDLMKLKSFCTTKETISKVKDSPQIGRK